jgi:alpha-L-fucosidase
MLARHRAQLIELVSNYGAIDMLCLDIWLGKQVWPELRKTLLEIRKRQPDVMLRARGIGNYGDYYTPENFVPASKEATDVPWFVIHKLGPSFSYEADAAKYKGTPWVIHNLIDAVAKGGNFMVGIGPDPNGRFHPTAIAQLKSAGAWLKVNGEGIYGTRAREQWTEGETVRLVRSKDGRYTYAHCLAWPGATLKLKSVRWQPGAPVRLLGVREPLKVEADSSGGVTVHMPEAASRGVEGAPAIAWTVRIPVANGDR